MISIKEGMCVIYLLHMHIAYKIKEHTIIPMTILKQWPIVVLPIHWPLHGQDISKQGSVHVN